MDSFLKWAGGKRWLIRNVEWRVPDTFRNYIEPFLGGGSVFFSIAPASGVLSDCNRELINMYRVLRDKPLGLRDDMLRHQRLHSKEYYYEIRSSSPTDRLTRASRFLYLNRACWNGLFRVNRKGMFNVPKGSKNKVFFESDDYAGASKALKRMKLRACDFEPVIDAAEAGDFIFVDPPYTVKHNLNGFVKYNEKMFSWDDQQRLAHCVKRAVERGCMVAVTNADHKSIHDLYRFAEYRCLSRLSILAAQSEHRVGTTEALFTCNL